MDEEQEILQSSLEQSDKISIGSFFGSPIGGLANRAISQSNTSLKSSITNRNLIASLQASIELLRGQLQQITNYVLLDRQERGRIVKQRETEAFEREDAIQKGIIRPENAQPRGLEDSLPFFPEARFSEGLTAGMSSIGERQGVAQFQERFVEGSRPFFFGGLVPGSGNADTVNAKLTPGEFVVPKKTVENFSSNFFNDLSEKENVKKNDYFVEGETEFDDFDGKTFYNPKDARNFLKKNDPKILETYGNMLKSDDTQSISINEEATLQGGKVVSGNMNQSDAERNIQRLELESERFDAITTYGYDSPEANAVRKKLMILSGTPERAIYTDKKGNLKVKGYSTYGGETTVEGDEKGKGLFGGLFGGGKKNENVKSDEKEGRGLFGAIGGTIDAATGNLTDFDKKGGKPFGLMRGITGTIDAATGGLTDLDRRGGKPFGLMRGITGSIDAMTGGLTDLDRRGGKPFGTMRLATGVADAMTGNLFDFDRRGRGEEKKKKLRNKDGGYVGDHARKKNFQNMMDKYGPSDKLTRKDFKSDEDFEFYKNNFGDLEDTQLQNKSDQLPMKTTVNPDGSITSKGSGTLIGGELVKPGQPLSENQKAAKALGSLMGNTEKEMTEGFSTYPSKSETPSIEPASENNLKVAPSESIKQTSQGLMSPPPPPQSETIELPPQTQGDGGGDNSIPQAAPSFSASSPSHDALTGTESPLIFVEVISNPFLSIP